MALEAVGFDSLNDFLTSVFALKYKAFSFYTYGFAFGMVMTFLKYISQGTALYIYSPPKGIAILFGITALDFILGLSNSITNTKEGIKAGKVSKSIVRFLTQVAFVAFMFHTNTVWPYFIQAWMVDTLLFVFVISTAWSAFQNARDLGLVTQEQFEIVESFVNVRSLIGKIVNRKKSENGGDHQH